MQAGAYRIWRSPYSDFYKEETLHAAEHYTDDFFEELAGTGFNAVWIRGIMRDIVRTRVFPELGPNSDAHLRSLRTVVERGQKAGVGVFLYMQPPMGMSPGDPFWRQHPEARGATVKFFRHHMTSMCTSEAKVRSFLHEGAETLSRELPGLQGAILITASEFQAHCHSHYCTNPERVPDGIPAVPLDCPRCAERDPREIVNDVVESVYNGFQDAGHGAEVVAWNWSWSLYEPDPQTSIINRLPKDVMLMAGFERGDTKVILGKVRTIDEYSLSFAGPSQRFLKSYRVARRRGMRVMTKLQLATTHELATVPNLPLIGNLYDKAAAMRRLKIDSFMGCWNFGNMITSNTTAFSRFLTAKRLAPRAPAMRAFARDYLPGCDPALVVQAWDGFAEAMNSYPFTIPFLYYGPLNYAVARPIEPAPLDPRPSGPSWLRSRRGDGLESSLGCYTLEEITQGLGEVAEHWWEAVETFERGVRRCQAPAARSELDTVRVAGHSFRSGWNLYRAYKLRQEWDASKLPALQEIMRDELAHLPDALPIIARDKRMGYHSECQYRMYSPAAVRRKIRRLQALLGE